MRVESVLIYSIPMHPPHLETGEVCKWNGSGVASLHAHDDFAEAEEVGGPECFGEEVSWVVHSWKVLEADLAGLHRFVDGHEGGVHMAHAAELLAVLDGGAGGFVVDVNGDRAFLEQVELSQGVF